MREVKIMYLMEYPIDLPGGGQMSTQTLAEGIVQASAGEDNKTTGVIFKPIVVCPTLLTKKITDYPFEIVTYVTDENRELSKVSRIKNFLSRIGDFARIIRCKKPDIIHVSMSESLISFGFLRVPGFFRDIPFVYTDRGLCYGYRKWSKFCIMHTMKRAARMLTTTEFNRALWEQEQVKCPITVIPNTISKAFDDYEEGKRERLKAKYSLTKDDFVIGFAGRVSEEKDWPCVRRLIGALKETQIPFKVALVMSTYEERDAQIVADVKDGITSQIGEERLIFMENLSQSEISEYYYMVDVFVMTSIFESFGKAAVEAMSRKCAVLSTAVGGLPEVIGKDENLYDSSKPEELAVRMKYLYEHRDILDEDREFFYERYRNNYRKEVNVERHINLYKEVLGL